MTLAPALGLLLLSAHLATSIDIPKPLESLPIQQLYQPQPPAKIPVTYGERRCDNYYAGEIPPCLLRPWLPPYSYSTTEADNGEYRRRRSERVWRTVS